MTSKYPTNDDIAEALERIADLLEAQDANPFRAGAYRRAARRIAGQDREVAAWTMPDSDKELEELPDIGGRIAAAVREFVHSGRIGLLDRLEGEIAPEDLLRTVPNIGVKLARRLHSELGIETLEELEVAAHKGEIERVPGIGRRRAGAIRDSVGALLNRSGRRRALRRQYLSDRDGGAAERQDTAQPSVDLILQVDAEYRSKADTGRLKTIAPRRFNPTGESWLPILHTDRRGWDFTALYSNTARAHELGKVRDWVVIYFDRDGHEDQSTVVTETAGPLKGRRVIRGRENECRRHYADRDGQIENR